MPSPTSMSPITWERGRSRLLPGVHFREKKNQSGRFLYFGDRLSNARDVSLPTFRPRARARTICRTAPTCATRPAAAARGRLARERHRRFERWDQADCLIIMGVNAASNAPHADVARQSLSAGRPDRAHQSARRSGGRAPSFPHDLVDMALFRSTPVGTFNVQPRIGGRHGLDARRCQTSPSRPRARTPTPSIGRSSSVTRRAFAAYLVMLDEISCRNWSGNRGIDGKIRGWAKSPQSKAAIIAWCLGVTQQEHAVDTIREIVNVLLLRGNPWARGRRPQPDPRPFPCAGNRTCGIDHRPDENGWPVSTGLRHQVAPRTRAGYGAGDSRHDARGGGNFVGMAEILPARFRTPPTPSPAPAKCDLTIQVSTKLNRTTSSTAATPSILPPRAHRKGSRPGRAFKVTVEDSMSMVHLSYGMVAPCSPDFALRGPRSSPEWQGRRCATARRLGTMPPTTTRFATRWRKRLKGFEDFNRVRQPLGFPAPAGTRTGFSHGHGPGEFPSRRWRTLAPAAAPPARQHALTINGTREHLFGQRPLTGASRISAPDFHEQKTTWVNVAKI